MFFPLIASGLLYFLLLILLPNALTSLSLNPIHIIDWVFFSSPSRPLHLTLIVDTYGLVFSCTVLFISANVIIFTHFYIAEDPFINRFVALVLRFVLSINFLIFIPNLISLLLGWDGLGLTSFLLVIYYQNPKSLAAGIITALTNRIGDVLILISIAWALNSTWNIMYFWESSFIIPLAIFITVAAITKSAQIPFSRWLPAAIAAPTPVSALVHSSTLVTAGIFLLFRFYPFLSTHIMFNKILLILASLTALIAGLSAITECDIKKIIALSTLSQLRVIIIRLAIGAPFLAFFHLITHALFKALLFLAAGRLIHLHSHTQDLRYIGNSSLTSPFISSILIVANTALCGAPFIAGFYSKDLILEFSLFSPINFLFLTIFFIATGLTARYSTRFIIRVIWAPRACSPLSQFESQEFSMVVPIVILALGAIVGGRLLNWAIITPTFEAFLPSNLKGLTIFVTVLGVFLAWSYGSSTNSSFSWLLFSPTLNWASCTIWFLAPVSSQGLLKTPYYFAHIFSKSVDAGWVELAGGQGALLAVSQTSSYIQSSSHKLIPSHLTIILLTLPLIIFIFLGSLKLKHDTEDVNIGISSWYL